MPPWSTILQQITEAGERGVENPFLAVRRMYLDELYNKTQRDTIIYSTGWTQYEASGLQFSLNSSDIQGFMEVVHGLDDENLDVILHSPGGSAEATEQIVDYLRAKFDDIRIFVPQAAMSAATMLCCAADEIVMGEHSSLGPIDPQFSVPTPIANRSTPAHAIIDQFDMAKDDIRTRQDLLAWLPILRQYAPGLLAECDEAIRMSRDLVEEWARNYMHADKDEPERQRLATEMAEFLSDRSFFKSHSRRISREQAHDHGFDVVSLEDDNELQDLVLSVYHATIHTHRGLPVAKLIENQNGRSFFRRVATSSDSDDGGSVAQYERPGQIDDISETALGIEDPDEQSDENVQGDCQENDAEE